MTRAFASRLTALALLLTPGIANAQLAHRPFAVGGGEGGGGAQGGVVGWLLSVQSTLTHAIANDVKALHDNPSAVWALVGLGLVYGVVHAAGPGHGKAIIASYVTANDRAVRRGVVLAFLAAMLQALVAIVVVGLMAAVLNATSTEMNRAADFLALASDLGVAAIGAYLVFAKGRALIGTLQRRFAGKSALRESVLLASAPWRAAPVAASLASFRAADPAAGTARLAECDHQHAPDASTLGAGFSWRGAATTVVAAGSRPCSGALLVLVFALSQGLFSAGVLATFAMAFGTAVTTGALAALAATFKSAALRFAAGDDSRVAIVARVVEFAAALAVLGFGLALAFASGQAA